jgi:hypothetical protein
MYVAANQPLGWQSLSVQLLIQFVLRCSSRCLVQARVRRIGKGCLGEIDSRHCRAPHTTECLSGATRLGRFACSDLYHNVRQLAK